MKRCVIGAALSLLAACMLAGCSTAQMKGTPFFTGEYEKRIGPAEDRVNLWPLLYYRNPALSVLWPLAEKTDDHVALRPLMSVYGLDAGRPVYNVLWPIARYETHTGEGRVFPVFWGKDYRTVFPLYWHQGEPLGKGGFDALFPLWIVSRHAPYSDIHLLWPFVNVRNQRRSQGWRVWPIAGHYERANGTYSFQAWPLAHQWSDRNSEHAGHTILPFYYYARNRDAATFLSLPYSRKRTADHTGWDLVPPLAYRSFDQDTRRTITPLSYASTGEHGKTLATWLGGYRRRDDESWWAALPLLSGGHRGEDTRTIWLGGPLAHYGRRGDRTSHHVFPFYYRRREGDASLLLSPLWSAGRTGDARSWQLIPPCYYRLETPEGVSYHVVPFYYRNERTGTFLSPLYAHWQGRNGARTTAFPLALSLLSTEPDRTDVWGLAGLTHWSWGEKPGSRHILPLFYQNADTGTFVSPLAASWEHAGRRTLLLSPALSWYTREKGRRDWWLGGPLAHISRGEQAGPSHVFPLFYHDGRADTFVSPTWAKWRDGNTTHWAVPPLLSWYSREAQTRRLNLLLGVYNREWSGDRTSGHLLPLYLYRDADEFYTLLFGWNRDKQDGFVYPFTPLVGRWHGDEPGGWLFPFFSWRKSEAADRLRGTFLWGTFEKQGETGGSGIFPIYTYRNKGPIDTEPPPHVNYATYGKRFLSLPFCWYRNQVHIRPNPSGSEAAGDARTRVRIRKHGFFPLWSYSRRERQPDGSESVDGRLLLALYDYQRRKPDPAEETEYVRSRILWRLWHYERSNHDVSVDAFPAITYDRRGDRFKKISFLWRAFRYERDEHGVDLDLLFLPLKRAPRDAAEPEPIENPPPAAPGPRAADKT